MYWLSIGISNVSLVAFSIIGIWILLVMATGYLGRKLWLKSKNKRISRYSKLIAILDFGTMGCGILIFAYYVFILLFKISPGLLVTAITIYPLAAIIMIFLSRAMLKKPDNFTDGSDSSIFDKTGEERKDDHD